MSEAVFLLADLQARGLRISVTPDLRLKIEPKGAATGEELQRLRENKEELIATLTMSREAMPENNWQSIGQNCSRCGGKVESKSMKNLQYQRCRNNCFDRWNWVASA